MLDLFQIATRLLRASITRLESIQQEGAMENQRFVQAGDWMVTVERENKVSFRNEVTGESGTVYLIGRSIDHFTGVKDLPLNVYYGLRILGFDYKSQDS